MGMATTTEPTKARLKARLKVRAYQALSDLDAPPGRRMRVRARNELAAVTVTVEPAGDARVDQPRRRRVGAWVSPTETLMLTKLGESVMTRVDLARRCGMACDPKFKTLVNNLIERGILEESDSPQGVRAAK
jgi:hypothetical protein